MDGDDIPQSLVLNYVYELPFGQGKKFGGGVNKAEDAIVGGWQVTGITTAQSGFPMSIGPNGDNASVYGGNQHADLTGAGFKTGSCGKGTSTNPIIAVGTKYCFFNPAAFTSPANYTFGNAPRYFSNLRAPKYVDEDLANPKVVQNWRRSFACRSVPRCSTRSTTPISIRPMPAPGIPPWARPQAPREPDKCRAWLR